MATKKKTKKQTTPTPTPTTPPVDNDPLSAENQKKYAEFVDSVIGRGSAYGQGLANKYFSEGSMGRVDEHISPEQQQAIDELHRRYTNSLTRSPESQMILDKWNSSLGGLDAPENVALREQMQQEGDRNYLNNVANITQQNAKYGVTGAAATARLGNAQEDQANARRATDRDLLVENVNQKRAALTGLQNYNTTLEQNENANQSDALKQYYGGVENKSQEELSRQTYNESNAGAEKAGAAAAEMGGTGIYAGMLGNAAAQAQAGNAQTQLNDIIKKQLDLAAKTNAAYTSKLGA